MTRFTRAGRAFEAFTGDAPRKVKTSPLEDGDVVGWALGPAVGVAYEAVRDGEKAQYFHEFAKADRPTLVAREDGRKLFFSGGNYTVTDHGIEDMSKLFVVNPSPRRGLKRNPMARAKRNRSGQFVKGHRRAAAPKRRRRSHSRQVAIFTGNPIRKRRRHRATAKRAYRRNPAGRRTYRRNPSRRAGGMGGFAGMLIPAFGVGAGAVGTEMFMGYLPIPAAWKSGVMRQVTKGALGLAAGWGIAHFLKQKKLGFYVMAGAVVIAVHDALKEAITAKLPGNAGAFGQYVAPLRHQFAGHHKGMGYINPAMTRPRFGQYVRPLHSQFAGSTPIMHHPGGETEFQA